mmetsp:Transcript_95936/g.311112  ORF Transcript_95936/g.311112 Transcript_95936/m.311112 type:complete len:124 (+) Transcript_95936:116-487(+)
MADLLELGLGGVELNAQCCFSPLGVKTKFAIFKLFLECLGGWLMRWLTELEKHVEDEGEGGGGGGGGGRGSLRAVKVQSGPPALEGDANDEPTEKRGRGRPRKVVASAPMRCGSLPAAFCRNE